MKNLSAILALVALAGAHSMAVAADPQAGKEKAQVCAACHGANGHSVNPEWPNLAGQHASYTTKQLVDLKAGETRSNPVMAQQVQNLSEEDMANLGAYFASLTPAGGFVSEERLALGQRLYRGGNQDTGVPACIACHGPSGEGDPMGGVPVLSGQRVPYTVLQLEAFRGGTRSNDRNGMMRDASRFLSDAEIRAVAEYVAGLH